MFLYSLRGWEHCVTIQNEKEFTQEEFEKMCCETHDMGNGYREISHLICSLKKYGFMPIKYQAGFFTDGD